MSFSSDMQNFPTIKNQRKYVSDQKEAYGNPTDLKFYYIL